MRMMFLRIGFHVIFASAFLFLGCSNSPKRPLNVPVSAVWAGGADGGVFIDCAPSQKGEPNTCTVYQERGTVYMNGKFILQNQNRGAKAEELKFDSADGKRIYLEHNLVLIPVQAADFDSPPQQRRIS
jgi:hypothetical protein